MVYLEKRGTTGQAMPSPSPGPLLLKVLSARPAFQSDFTLPWHLAWASAAGQWV